MHEEVEEAVKETVEITDEHTEGDHKNAGIQVKPKVNSACKFLVTICVLDVIRLVWTGVQVKLECNVTTRHIGVQCGLRSNTKEIGIQCTLPPKQQDPADSEVSSSIESSDIETDEVLESSFSSRGYSSS